VRLVMEPGSSQSLCGLLAAGPCTGHAVYLWEAPWGRWSPTMGFPVTYRRTPPSYRS